MATHLKIGAQATITDKNQIRDYLSAGSLFVDRGYTSHEHFAEVGLIHMNGRLYDPLLRRFLNADENIQHPHNTQNYNKYGYVMNNPLMYNDPSGEFIFTALAAWLGSKLLAAIIVGAAVGLASYSVGVLVTGQSWNIGSALKATFFGAVGGAATFGIGSLFQVGSVIQAVGEVKFLVQAMAHGVSQGVLSVMQGGDFLSGAASGFLGSLGASGFGAIAGDWAGKAGGQIAFGALAGGVGSELTGGNFWQGAVIGGIVAGLNHAMHSGDMEPDNGYDKNGKKINDNGGNTTDYRYDDNGNIVSSTSVKITFSQGGEVSSSFEGYGFRHYSQGTGGAMMDPSLDIVSFATSLGEIKAGYTLLKMGLTSVPKLTTAGFRMMKVGDASSSALKSSVFFTKFLRNAGLNFSVKSWPTLYTPAKTLGTFLGRNSPIIGAGMMGHGGYSIYNKTK